MSQNNSTQLKITQLFLTQFFNSPSLLKDYHELEPFITRPVVIKELVSNFVASQMDNQPFLAMHWRFDDDWLDMCTIERGVNSRKQNAAICDLISNLNYNMETEINFKNKIQNILDEYKLDYIYLATTPNNKNLIKLIKLYFGDKIKTYVDFEKTVNQHLYPGYFKNSYYSSLIEQELCYRSAFFLGSGLSSWTQTVLTDRLAAGNNNHGSILLRLGDPHPIPPGYPPVIFQFPEGWFKFTFPEDEVTGLMYSQDHSIGGSDESLDALRKKFGGNCYHKVKDVSFLKIYGPSYGNEILDQIVLRFANQNNLNTGVLIQDGQHMIDDYRFNYQNEMLLLDKKSVIQNQKISILSEYLGYSSGLKTAVTRSTRYVTLIQNPVNQQKAFFLKYANLTISEKSNNHLPYSAIFNSNLKTEEKMILFYSKPEEYYKPTDTYNYRLKNPTTHMLTKEIKYHNSEDDDFRLELVLVEELLLESLVVLMDKFCWDMHDILFYYTQIAEQQEKYTNLQLPPEIEKNITQWNDHDTNFYESRKKNVLNYLKHKPELGEKLNQFQQKLGELATACQEDVNSCLIKKSPNFNFPSRKIIPLKIRFNPNENHIFKRKIVNQFLSTGRWIDETDFRPDNCQLHPVPMYSDLELSQKLENKKFLVIGDGRTQYMFQLFEEITQIKPKIYFSHKFDDHLTDKVALIKSYQPDYLLLGEQWIWSTKDDQLQLAASDSTFDPNFYSPDLAALSLLLEEIEKLLLVKPKMKILLTGAEPYLKTSQLTDQMSINIESSRLILNEHLEKLINDLNHENIYFMKNNVLSSYDQDHNLIRRVGKDKFDRLDFKNKYMSFSHIEHAGLRSDFKIILRYFLEEFSNLCG